MEQSANKKVVIVGGGFGGLACAIELVSHSDVSITLIDEHNYQQFHPLLYQVAAGLLSSDNAAFALRDLLRDYPHVAVQMDAAASVDLKQRSIITASGKTHGGDFLVLATGSRVNFYGIAGAAQNTFPLYSLTDAEKLRSAILRAFEDADRDPAKARDGINFVVVGGGPTGVEMAGTLCDVTKDLLEKDFRHIDNMRTQVFLIELGSSVLATFLPASRDYAHSTLKKKGVTVRLGVAVEQVQPDGVVLSGGEKISSRIVIWAAGLQSAAVPAKPVPPSSRGRIEVQNDLSVPGFDGVYAIGDLANAIGSDGKPLPQLAAVAQQAGRHCARNILASLKGEPARPFAYSDRGILAMVGRNAAVAELGKSHHELQGTIAFAAWLGIHVALLSAPRARVDAIVEWAWDYFTGEHAEELIDR